MLAAGKCGTKQVSLILDGIEKKLSYNPAAWRAHLNQHDWNNHNAKQYANWTDLWHSKKWFLINAEFGKIDKLTAEMTKEIRGEIVTNPLAQLNLDMAIMAGSFIDIDRSLALGAKLDTKAHMNPKHKEAIDRHILGGSYDQTLYFAIPLVAELSHIEMALEFSTPAVAAHILRRMGFDDAKAAEEKLGEQCKPYEQWEATLRLFDKQATWEKSSNWAERATASHTLPKSEQTQSWGERAEASKAQAQPQAAK